MRVFATGFVALVIAALCYSVCDARTYTVAPGDTITSIAESHNIAVSELARLNQLEGTDVRAGTVLVLDEETSVPLDPKVVAAARKAALAAESSLVPTKPAPTSRSGHHRQPTQRNPRSAASPKASRPEPRRLPRG